MIHSPAAVAATALALLVAVLAGCGGEEESGAPRDLSILYTHFDGSMPPPYHQEWGILLRPNGTGDITYRPDYPEAGVPTYRAPLDVGEAEIDRLYTEMRDAGLLEGGIAPAPNPPVGGPIDRASVVADDKGVEIPSFDEEGEVPLDPVLKEIRALVPDEVWARFARQRDAYVKARGSAPE